MNETQKRVLIHAVAALRDAAILYGEVYTRTIRGEYVRADIIEARQKSMDEAMQDVLEAVKAL